MFRVQGVSPPPLLLYRVGIAALLVMLLHSYFSHRSQLEIVIQSAKRDLETCHANSESIFSKLKELLHFEPTVDAFLVNLQLSGSTAQVDFLDVIYEHKKKMELQSEIQKNDSLRKVTEMRKSVVACRAELDKARERIVSLEKYTTPPLNVEKLKVTVEEALQLQKDETERLQKKVKELEDELKKNRKELETVKGEVDECQRTVRQHVGALPVAHYTQNETAFFNRKHRVGEELAFDRGAIEHHQREIIPGAVLMQKIEHKKKQKEEIDVHPDDRKDKDDYVNEQPDAAEEDYKEHHE